MYQLKERLAEGFLKLPDVRLNGMEIREGAPQILSASFLGVRSEVLASYSGRKRHLCFSRKRLLQPQKKSCRNLKCNGNGSSPKRKYAEIQFFRGKYI